METITTNEAFHHLVLLLRLHKDQDYLIEIAKKQGVILTKSKIKAWRNKDPDSPDYRVLPRKLLDKIITALHEEHLVHDTDSEGHA